MSRVCIIPARGGSQRLPRKALRTFAGKPILAHSIAAAQACRLCDVVAVSTDDEEIASAAQAYGATVIERPETLAQDHVGTQEVVRHALTVIPAEQALCIYPCAPMTAAADLMRGWRLLHAPGTAYAVPVGKWLSDPGQWYWGWAWAFAGRVPLLGEHTAMVAIDARRAVDVNTIEDWQAMELAYAALEAG